MVSTRAPWLLDRRLCCLVLAATGLPGLAAPLELQAFTENLPPLNYQEDGQVQGFSCELLRLMAAEVGLPLRIEVLPWLRAVHETARQREGLLFSLTRLPEREAQYQWVGPITQRRILIYRLKTRSDVQPASLAQLGAQRIGVVRDSASAMQLQAAGLSLDTHLEQGQDDGHNLRKLLAGRMELVVMLDWAAAWHLRRQQLPPDTLTPVLPLDVDKSYWYGLPAGADPALVRRLQDALDRIKRDGRWERLRQRTLGGA